MQKSITARHFDLTPELRNHADIEIDGLTRYFDNIISAELILDKERHRQKAELKVKVYKETLAGTGETDDMYNSIAMAVDKVKGQLKRYKGKLKDKKPDRITDLTEETTRPRTNDEELDV
ncbi:MAG: ribosome-associated translation inhibitor RaiA [Candidatus Zixiibacteriota bacterium]|nr:MAG: ribosome-associated translation inhibitor RaiA [candidate division Zixibacteria bacterium]